MRRLALAVVVVVPLTVAVVFAGLINGVSRLLQYMNSALEEW